MHAWVAGLRQGDRILFVNGIACAERTVDAVMQQLVHPAAAVRLRVRFDPHGYRAQQTALDDEVPGPCGGDVSILCGLVVAWFRFLISHSCRMVGIFEPVADVVIFLEQHRSRLSLYHHVVRV